MTTYFECELEGDPRNPIYPNDQRHSKYEDYLAWAEKLEAEGITHATIVPIRPVEVIKFKLEIADKK